MEGVRGFAVILVFFVHFHALFGAYSAPQSVLYSVSRVVGTVGNSGVDLFFVLSGYLIYGTLLRSPKPYLSFLWRRIVRIYPAFLCVLGITIALSLAAPDHGRLQGSPSSALGYVLQNLLLLPGIFRIEPIVTVAWSLSYEFFFYLSMPLLFVCMRLRNWKASARFLIFGIAWLCYGGYSLYSPGFRNRLLMFVVGILLYEALHFRVFQRALTGLGEYAAVAAFVLSLAFYYAFEGPSPHAQQHAVYKTSILGVSCFWFLAYAIGFPGRLGKCFCWAPLRYLGNMSYSYYLIHGLTLKIISVFVLARIGHLAISNSTVLFCLLVGFSACWVTSSLLFALVEKPFSIDKRNVVSRNSSSERNSLRNVSSVAIARSQSAGEF